MKTRVQDQIVTDKEARQILRDNQIELGMDHRSAVQFVTEVLVWMEAVAVKEGELALIHEEERAQYCGQTVLGAATQASNLMVERQPRSIHFVQ